MSALASSVSVASSKNSGERNFSSSLTDDKKMGAAIRLKRLADCIKKHIWYEYICATTVELVSAELYWPDRANEWAMWENYVNRWSPLNFFFLIPLLSTI